MPLSDWVSSHFNIAILYQDNVFAYSALLLMTIVFVCLDLWQTDHHEVTVRRAIIWSLCWFFLALVFAVGLYFCWQWYEPESHYQPHQAATAFITGYLLEKSLSVDNLFIFAIIFSQYQVPEALRPRALLWGVVGALCLRAVMIVIGAQLLEHYHWVLYLFALFLIWTGIRLAKSHADEEEEVNTSPEKVIRRFFRVSDDFAGNAFFIKKAGRRYVTPMLIVVGVIAVMDVMFALDSIPAIFAVTQEPFLVLAANIFSLLGLRSLYFVLQAMIDKFIYLKPALAIIMVFIGVKMLLVHTSYEIPTLVSLVVLVLVMATAVMASLWRETCSQR